MFPVSYCICLCRYQCNANVICVCLPPCLVKSPVYPNPRLLVHGSPCRTWQNNRYINKVSGAPPPSFVFSIFWKVLVCLFSSSAAMEFAACVLALIRRDLSFVEYGGEFCGLAAVAELHDTAILHLFWLGACYHHPMDLPDTTGLCWREGIF